MAEASLKKTAAGAAPTGDVNVTDRCNRLLGELCSAGNPIDPRAIRALNALIDNIDISNRCTRQLGTLCFGGVPIDPRDRNWDLDFAIDQVDASGSNINATIVGIPNVDVIDRCARLLGQLCFGGIPIDPRIIRFLAFATDSIDVSGSAVGRTWDLDFATDQVDASGSNVNATVVGTPDVNVTDREDREVGLVTMKDAFMGLRLMADYLKDIPLTIDPSTSRVRTIIEAGSLTSVTTVSTVTNLAKIGGNAANSFIFDTLDIAYNTAIRAQII